MAHVITTHAFTWARPIITKAMTELLDRVFVFAVEWVAWCVSIPFHFWFC